MKNNENGRSMVEMLGVLAIIGVLSVAGIAGYTMAMRAYRANEIVNAASLLYTAGRTQNAGLGNAPLTYATAFGLPTGAALPGGLTALTYNAPTTGNDGTVTGTTASGDDCTAVANKVGNTVGAAIRATCSGTSLTLTYSSTATE